MTALNNSWTNWVHMCTHTFTPRLSYFCGSQLADRVTLHWKLPPLPASLSSQMSYVRRPALRDKDRHSVSKRDLATSKLSCESRRKGGMRGFYQAVTGQKEIPPPTPDGKNRCTMSVWKYLLFAFVLFGGWNIPQRSCHPESWMTRSHA